MKGDIAIAQEEEDRLCTKIEREITERWEKIEREGGQMKEIEEIKNEIETIIDCSLHYTQIGRKDRDLLSENLKCFFNEKLLSALQKAEDEKKMLEDQLDRTQNNLGRLAEQIRKLDEKYNQVCNVMNEQNSLIATHLNLPGDGRLLSEQVIEAFDKAEERVKLLNQRIKEMEAQATRTESILDSAKEKVKELQSERDKTYFDMVEYINKVKELEERIEATYNKYLAPGQYSNVYGIRDAIKKLIEKK